MHSFAGMIVWVIFRGPGEFETVGEILTCFCKAPHWNCNEVFWYRHAPCEWKHPKGTYLCRDDPPQPRFPSPRRTRSHQSTLQKNAYSEYGIYMNLYQRRFPFPVHLEAKFKEPSVGLCGILETSGEKLLTSIKCEWCNADFLGSALVRCVVDIIIIMREQICPLTLISII